jgi:hypothetical protein
MQQALLSYRVLGFLDKGGVRSIFMSSGSDVLVLKQGENFGERNRFVVAEITATELVVSSRDRSVTVRLPLGEVDSREPAVMSPVNVSRPEIDAEPVPDAPAPRLTRRARTLPTEEPSEESPQGEEMPAASGEPPMDPTSGEEE